MGAHEFTDSLLAEPVRARRVYLADTTLIGSLQQVERRAIRQVADGVGAAIGQPELRRPEDEARNHALKPAESGSQS